jgi:membrane protease YdiL (CAAX protease family)
MSSAVPTDPAPLTMAPPERPELPDGVEPTPVRPRWKPHTAWLALLAGFGGALVGALVLGVIAALFGASITDPPPVVSILATVVQDLSLIAAAVLFASMVARPAPWQFGLRAIGAKPFAGWIVASYVVFIAFSAAWVALLHIKQKDDLPSELGADKSTVALVAVAFLVTVVAPIAEEVFFRGYFFGALRNWKGFWPAAVITGVVFGGIHAGSAPVGYLVPLAVFGVLLCALYVRTRSLYPCITLHAINNSIALGTTQHWGWQVLVLLAASLATLALFAWVVRRRFGPAPPYLLPV